jgi:hypothetical protein
LHFEIYPVIGLVQLHKDDLHLPRDWISEVSEMDYLITNKHGRGLVCIPGYSIKDEGGRREIF